MFINLADTSDSFNVKLGLHKFIALAPCVLFNTQVEGKPESYYENGLYKFPSADIHAIMGPNWEKNQEKICAQFD